MEFPCSWRYTDRNKYLYNNKEIQDDVADVDNNGDGIPDFTLQLYDYGFRNYDPAIGRFIEVDPISEDFYHVSTYNYAENNPIIGIDLWGLQLIPVISAEAQKRRNEASKKFFKGVKAFAEGAVAAFFAPFNAVSNDHAAGNARMHGMDERATELSEAAAQDYKTAAADVLVGGAVGTTLKSIKNSNLESLFKQTDDAISHMQKTGQSPATVVGGKLPNGAIEVGPAGGPPKIIAPSLESSANKIGGVGTKRNGNTVGCCAEFKVGNQLLLKNPSYKPTDIQFTPAIRPRTNQIIPPCQNCQDIFNFQY